MKMGFTGTQDGMTDDQVAVIVEVITELTEMTEMHHGDCIGADEQFFTIVREQLPNVKIIGHIPDVDDKRAFCKNDVERDPLPYLVRNKNIVAEADVMLATPMGPERKRGSGTWATIRYARKAGIRLAIIWPDGKYIYENQS
jgi:hypothetical protein